MQDDKTLQQHEQAIRQRPQEATSVASAAAQPPEIPVQADVDWQETAGRQVYASVEGGIDEEETAGWQVALGAEEVEALRAGVGKSVAEGRKRMGGRGEASEGEEGRKGGVGLGGEGEEGEGKPLGIEGEAAVLVGGEGGGEAGGESTGGEVEEKRGVGFGGEGVEGEGKPLAIEGEAAVLVGGEGGAGGGGERWDVPLVPDMPGVLSLGDAMGGAKHMAFSTWSAAAAHTAAADTVSHRTPLQLQAAVTSAAHTAADTASAGTAAVGRAAAGMVGVDTNAPPIGIPLGSSSLPTATDEAQMGAAALVAGETAPERREQPDRTEQPSSQ
ncbi:unnamed protein product [Closterium sp. NIES-65]|nr:unnamed protein product [Closterium sp. NIES-65]